MAAVSILIDQIEEEEEKKEEEEEEEEEKQPDLSQLLRERSRLVTERIAAGQRIRLLDDAYRLVEEEIRKTCRHDWVSMGRNMQLYAQTTWQCRACRLIR